MRQLGKGQSVMFFAPGEVDRRIRGLIPTAQEPENDVRVIDILRWAMRETCRDIAHHLPHWAQQGVDHHWRFSAYKKFNSKGKRKVLRKTWLQPESRTLEEMYDPISKAKGAELGPGIKDVPSLRERLERFGAIRSTDVRMAKEQEREVNREVDIERRAEHQNLKPPKIFPAKHIIRDDIRNFVSTGIISRHSKSVIPLLTPTGIDKALTSMQMWSPTPLATRDFAITTTNTRIAQLSDYLRPVNWILSSGSGRDSTAIVISPYEANELLPFIRKSEKVRLHIYAARVTASMRSFSDLSFYTIPESPERRWVPLAHLRTELNLFVGQLFFDGREENQRVCELLALYLVHPGADLEQIWVDGFVPPAYRTGKKSPLSTSAIATLKRLTVLRRKGIGFDGTDLGRVLNARLSSGEFAS